jgi:hypothetical protein
MRERNVASGAWCDFEPFNPGKNELTRRFYSTIGRVAKEPTAASFREKPFGNPSDMTYDDVAKIALRCFFQDRDTSDQALSPEKTPGPSERNACLAIPHVFAKPAHYRHVFPRLRL